MYEYQKVHNTEVARDSISSVTDKTLHDITAQTSMSVQCVVLGGSIDVEDASGSDATISLSDGTASTPVKLYTVSGDTTGYKQLPEVPDVMKTSNGNDLGLSMNGDSNAKAIVTVLVGEEY